MKEGMKEVCLHIESATQAEIDDTIVWPTRIFGGTDEEHAQHLNL